MALLLAIEGADGVGKNTAAQGTVAALQTQGVSATLISFPRYADTIGGKTLGDVLGGRMGIDANPQTAAVLYALDRLESRDVIEAAAVAHEVVVFDRYIASNMAYQAARGDAGGSRAMMDWIAALETESFTLPSPTLSIYLDTPWETARELILQKRQRSYTERSYDEYEADAALQLRVRGNYEAMVVADLMGPWRTVSTCAAGAMRTRDAIVDEIVSLLSL